MTTQRFSTELRGLAKEGGTACASQPSTWGAIASWAGASRLLMDAVAEIPRLTAAGPPLLAIPAPAKHRSGAVRRIRGSKLICSNESGCGGTAITRGRWAEHIKTPARASPAGSAIPIRPLATTKNTCRLISICFLRSSHRAASTYRAPLTTPGRARSQIPCAKYCGETYELCTAKRGLGLKNIPSLARWIKAAASLIISHRGGHSLRSTIGMNTSITQTRC